MDLEDAFNKVREIIDGITQIADDASLLTYQCSDVVSEIWNILTAVGQLLNYVELKVPIHKREPFSLWKNNFFGVIETDGNGLVQMYNSNQFTSTIKLRLRGIAAHLKAWMDFNIGEYK